MKDPEQELADAHEWIKKANDAARRFHAHMAAWPLMKHLWVIHREIADEAEFRAFVAAHTPIRAERARLMAQTWSVARRRRDLRELAQRSPKAALELIQASVKAGVDIEDVTDEEVMSIFARPPRAQHRHIRELILKAKGEA
jgi:hypothetical protein